MKRKLITGAVSLLFALVLLSLSVWVITGELKAYDSDDIWQTLKSLPTERLLFASTLTILSYLTMTGYDALALRYIRHPLPYRKIALVAFTSYAISSSLGFTLLTSSAIRYRLYSSWGLSTIEIAKVIAFGQLSFWLGTFALGGILFLSTPTLTPTALNLPFSSLFPLGTICLALVLGYLLLSLFNKRSLTFGKLAFRIPSPRFSLSQIAIYTVERVLEGSVLYILLTTSALLSFPVFFRIYLPAQIAGLFSTVPGGLGIFETAIILLLSPIISADTALGSLLAYRGIYYFLPLGVAVTILVIYEICQQRQN